MLGVRQQSNRICYGYYAEKSRPCYDLTVDMARSMAPRLRRAFAVSDIPSGSVQIEYFRRVGYPGP
jgi:hypothetical protein